MRVSQLPARTGRARRRAGGPAGFVAHRILSSLFVAAALTFGGPVSAVADVLTLEDIAELHAKGASDEVLISLIQASETDVQIGVSEVSWLIDLGVSNEVIQALFDKQNAPDAPSDDDGEWIEVEVDDVDDTRVIVVDRREYWPSLWTWAFSSHWPLRYCRSYAYHYPYRLAYWNCFPGGFGYLSPHFASVSLYGGWGLSYVWGHRRYYDPYVYYYDDPYCGPYGTYTYVSNSGHSYSHTHAHGPRHDGHYAPDRTLVDKGPTAVRPTKGGRGDDRPTRPIVKPARPDVANADPTVKPPRPRPRPDRPIVKPANPASRPQVKPAAPASRPQVKPAAKPKPRPQVRPKPRSESKPQVRPSKPRSESKPQVRPSSKPRSESKPQVRPSRPQSKPRPSARPSRTDRGKRESRSKGRR